MFDGLGSERTICNSSQTVTGTAMYEGFGQVVATTGSSSDPYMFAGTSSYRNDNDGGLLQVGARYYDPKTGRFITRDTVLTEQAYLYCDHDPINALDPSGHSYYINFNDLHSGGGGGNWWNKTKDFLRGFLDRLFGRDDDDDDWRNLPPGDQPSRIGGSVAKLPGGDFLHVDWGDNPVNPPKWELLLIPLGLLVCPEAAPLILAF